MAKMSSFLRHQLLLAAGTWTCSADEHVDSHIKTELAPEKVAELLRETKEEWVSFAEASQQEAAKSKMVTSCGDVVGALVNAAQGDRDRVAEYFAEVCKGPGTKGADAADCTNFAQGVVGSLSDDVQLNRENSFATFCEGYWASDIVTLVQQRRAREAQQKEKAQQEKRREEEQRAAQEKRREEQERQKQREEREQREHEKAAAAAARKEAAAAAAEKTKKLELERAAARTAAAAAKVVKQAAAAKKATAPVRKELSKPKPAAPKPDGHKPKPGPKPDGKEKQRPAKTAGFLSSAGTYLSNFFGSFFSAEKSTVATVSAKTSASVAARTSSASKKASSASAATTLSSRVIAASAALKSSTGRRSSSSRSKNASASSLHDLKRALASNSKLDAVKKTVQKAATTLKGKKSAGTVASKRSQKAQTTSSGSAVLKRAQPAATSAPNKHELGVGPVSEKVARGGLADFYSSWSKTATTSTGAASHVKAEVPKKAVVPSTKEVERKKEVTKKATTTSSRTSSASDQKPKTSSGMSLHVAAKVAAIKNRIAKKFDTKTTTKKAATATAVPAKKAAAGATKVSSGKLFEALHHLKKNAVAEGSASRTQPKGRKFLL